MTETLPIVDLAPFRADPERPGDAVERIGQACRRQGFFYVTGHGIPGDLIHRLEELSRRFFARPTEEKLAIRMEKAGRAWRGYFPVGDELTRGKPDQKEGIYFGAELPDDHPKVRAGVPLHGRNLFPDVPGFRETVLETLDGLTRLGHSIVSLIALSLELPADYFAVRYTRDPLILFRIFHYPPLPGAPGGADLWSVGEHTDYGLLTILHQDDRGGLQVKSEDRWIEAPPVPGTFVCNLGDMLDRMTGGIYRSTPHRVKNRSELGRLSFPFFFDPGFDAEVRPIFPDLPPREDKDERWDRSSVHEFRGTYGEYLLRKVGQVFPDLGRENLE